MYNINNYLYAFVFEIKLHLYGISWGHGICLVSNAKLMDSVSLTNSYTCN